MIGLVLPLMQRSRMTGYVSLLLLAAIICAFLFLRKATNAERARQRVTPEQLSLPIEKWVNVWSRKRRRRVLSQLPAPTEDGLSGERFIRISGQSRSALVYVLALPAVIVVLVIVALIWVNSYKPTRPLPALHTNVPRPRHHHHKQRPPDLHGPFLLHSPGWGFYHTLLLTVLLLGLGLVIGWSAYGVAKWSGVYFVLSDYRFRRVWIYPVWMFWLTNFPEEVELHMLSSKGANLGTIGKTFGGWGDLKLDTAGTADDKFFNRIPWVPDVTNFEEEIANAQRAAIPPVQRTQSDRQLELLENMDSNIALFTGGRSLSQQSGQKKSEHRGPTDDTGEIPTV